MSKSPFTETPIANMLEQAGAGISAKKICRQAWVSTVTYYKWKSKYSSMEATGLKHMKVLEVENAKLRRMRVELEMGKGP